MSQGRFCVNKTNKIIPVYKYEIPLYRPYTQIGRIYPREAFARFPVYGEGTETPILFLNSAGQLTEGFIDEVELADLLTLEEWDAFYSGVGEYPYDMEFIDGNWCITFKFRRTENVYTATGRYWGRVAAGMRVACLDTTDFFKNGSGQTHPNWKAINYVERSTDGAWIKVSGDGKDYGFVDTGLDHGSGPSKISMYGSW